MKEKEAKKEKTGAGRTRNFATVVYPDSAPEHWQDILTDHLVPAFISPLHDQDVNPTGEQKKPHYHVIIMFDGVKTTDQAKAIFKTIGGVGCEVVKSIRGYARYLCHLDNPEKHQYDTKDVRSLCGADFFTTISLAIDRFVAISEMEEFCEKYDIVSFYLLSRYASKHRADWARVLKESSTVYLKEYLQSRRWSKETNNLSIVDQVTGEVIL